MLTSLFVAPAVIESNTVTSLRRAALSVSHLPSQLCSPGRSSDRQTVTICLCPRLWLLLSLHASHQLDRVAFHLSRCLVPRPPFPFLMVNGVLF